MKSKPILVVMGGTSSEKDVSLRSGEAMYQALIEKGYCVERFVLTDRNAAEIIEKKPACVVLALHGKGGEDGCIQGMLELVGIPYTGSGVASSAVCMNKILSKKLIAFEGIRTAPFLSVGINDALNAAELVSDVLRKIGLPAVVKAPCQGSSVGVKIVKTQEELRCAIEEIYPLDHELLLEAYIPGKEVTIPVFKADGRVSTLPIIEITSENSFYDYQSKYTKGMSHHIIPARIGEATANEVRQMAEAAYKALDCRGLVRVDFMLDEKQTPYLMEINTLPGMTETSLVPDAARAAGQQFPDLVEQLVQEAVKVDEKK